MENGKDILDYAKIGKCISDIRRGKNMKQQDLSDETGLSISYISLVEKGVKGLSVTTLVLIADALDVSPNAILYGSHKMAKKNYGAEIEQLLSMCDSAERRIIFEVCAALKSGLKTLIGSY